MISFYYDHDIYRTLTINLRAKKLSNIFCFRGIGFYLNTHCDPPFKKA